MLARPSWLATARVHTHARPRIQLQLHRWTLASSPPPNGHVPSNPHRCFSRCPGVRQKSEDGILDTVAITKEVRERKEELEQARIEAYPRIQPVDSPSRVPVTVSAWLYPQSSSDEAEDGQSKAPDHITCAGRIVAVRSSGKKLVFFDIRTDTATVQVKLNYGSLPEPKPSIDEFQSLCRLLRRGDHILVHAIASSTRDGKPALEAVRMPALQSPCLQRFPVAERGTEHVSTEASGDRHIDMLTSLDAVRMIKTRHMVVQGIRQFLTEQGFIEVQTPILAGHAGGAIARAFETTATEFPDRKLSLRIAPELWLKRLMIGGLSKVFEIGPSFRNEGLDKTHNPEFTTCEFYAAYWTIEKLKATSEQLLAAIPWNSLHLDQRTTADDIRLINPDLARQLSPDTSQWIWQEYVDGGVESKEEASPAVGDTGPGFPVIDFIPALNDILGIELPNLGSPTARTDLLSVFERKQIPIPDRPTLPRLLDELSSQLLEPQCSVPTWIENTPACLSPLSKSFIHPSAPNNQPVAARAELFVGGKELVNCYEEENDPFEQRRKFMDQQRYAHELEGGAIDDEAMKVDEDYVRAMEWGLPPTGGWGMGVDRLLMLLTGRDRITDVLTFGNLRAVTKGAAKKVATGSGRAFWGNLIHDNHTASPQLHSLCIGLAKTIVSQGITTTSFISVRKFPPGNDGELTPERLATFYHHTGGGYEDLFANTKHHGLSYIYRTLGCRHSLQPTQSDYETPSIPCLTDEGFARFQEVQVLLCPDEARRTLQKAVELYDVPQPDGSGFFPKHIPSECFPTRPDQEFERWYNDVRDGIDHQEPPRVSVDSQTNSGNKSPYYSSYPAPHLHRRSSYVGQNGRSTDASRSTSREEDARTAAMMHRRRSVPDVISGLTADRDRHQYTRLDGRDGDSNKRSTAPRSHSAHRPAHTRQRSSTTPVSPIHAPPTHYPSALDRRQPEPSHSSFPQPPPAYTYVYVPTRRDGSQRQGGSRQRGRSTAKDDASSGSGSERRSNKRAAPPAPSPLRPDYVKVPSHRYPPRLRNETTIRKGK
ncbi:hypothetical protein DV735_g5013, partial [Chaetothyriales sp. CBS 134920]